MRNHALVIDFNRQLGGELCDIVFLYNFHFFFICKDELNIINKSAIKMDRTNPCSVYGKSKLDDENALLEVNPRVSIIIRTSWVFSNYGVNFVKTMFRLGSERKSLEVIYNQIGASTYARDLAKIILDISTKLENKNVEIFHYTNEGVLSWFDFSKEIMKMAKLIYRINPIEILQSQTLSQRPCFSLLCKSKIKNYYDIEIPYWKDSLKECLKRLGVVNW